MNVDRTLSVESRGLGSSPDTAVSPLEQVPCLGLPVCFRDQTVDGRFRVHPGPHSLLDHDPT